MEVGELPVDYTIFHQEGAVGVVPPRPNEKRYHQEAVVEVVDRPYLAQLVEVGVVEDLHY